MVGHVISRLADGHGCHLAFAVLGLMGLMIAVKSDVMAMGSVVMPSWPKTCR
jgi:hypothetical protein